MQPNLELARDTLGRLYLEAGDLPKAIAESRAACRLDPNDENTLYHLILALRRAHQTAEMPALLRRFTMLRAPTQATQKLEGGPTRDH